MIDAKLTGPAVSRVTHSSMFSESEATFSEDRRYRYTLMRRWHETNPLVAYVMLNSSTADEVKNDPTVERCERRARVLLPSESTHMSPRVHLRQLYRIEQGRPAAARVAGGYRS